MSAAAAVVGEAAAAVVGEVVAGVDVSGVVVVVVDCLIWV